MADATIPGWVVVGGGFACDRCRTPLRWEACEACSGLGCDLYDCGFRGGNWAWDCDCVRLAFAAMRANAAARDEVA